MSNTRGKQVQRSFMMIYALAAALASAAPPSEVGTYQGQLKLQGNPVNGLVDLRIGIWDKISNGSLLSESSYDAVEVVNGLFTVDLLADPQVFDTKPKFLEIEVRSPHDPTDTQAFSLLEPRQPIRPVPYALRALNDVADGHSLDAVDGSPTNAVFVDAAGNVGVGTTIPVGDLHVRGKTPLGQLVVTPSVADSSAQVLITENTSASLGAMMRYDGAANQWQVLGLSRDANNVPIENGPHLVVGRDNGRVGIGTAAPAEPLHVAGNVRLDGPNGLGIRNPQNLGAVMRFDWLNNVARLRLGGTDPGGTNGFDIQRIGDESLLRILDSGNVGIGTENPERRLEIEADQASVRLDTSNSTFGSALELRNTTQGALGLGFIRFMNATDTSTARGEILYRGDNSMSFSTNATERLRVNSTGNVGIGTTSPQSRLHVAGEIRSSSGGIRFPDNTVQTTATLQGPAGPAGPAGQRGQACWDLNNNGVGNVATEDRNGDGLVNVDDCRGDPGPTGVPATSFAVCGTSLSCNTACGGADNVLGESHENGSGTPGAGCSVTSDTGSCESISTLSDDCCVCRQP